MKVGRKSTKRWPFASLSLSPALKTSHWLRSESSDSERSDSRVGESVTWRSRHGSTPNCETVILFCFVCLFCFVSLVLFSFSFTLSVVHLVLPHYRNDSNSPNKQPTNPKLKKWNSHPRHPASRCRAERGASWNAASDSASGAVRGWLGCGDGRGRTSPSSDAQYKLILIKT